MMAGNEGAVFAGKDRRKGDEESLYFNVCRGEFVSLHTSIEQLKDIMLARFEAQSKDTNETNRRVQSLEQTVKGYNGLRGKVDAVTEMAKDALGYVHEAEKRQEKEDKDSGEKRMHIWKTTATGIIVPVIASLMTVMLALFAWGRMLATATGK